VTAPHTPVPYSRAMENEYMPNETRVIATVKKLINR
jgi:pyruvate/2-oxoglutarate/acetoin dehydrogenase E1 component